MKFPQETHDKDRGELNEHLIQLGWSAFFEQELQDKDQGQIPARVIGVRKNSFLVNQGGCEFTATPSGSLFNSSQASFPAVGDWVLLRDSVITSTLDRKNVLVRKAAGARNRKHGDDSARTQVIAANLDTAFIVCGLDRDFNLRRIERYLTMIYNCSIQPAVILTKADLHQHPDSFIREIEEIAFGVPVHLISAEDDTELSRLGSYFSPHRTVALVGSSGAGKSTLINRLYGEEIRTTGAVSRNLGKGKHVTTSRDLIILPSGGMVIDNPGIREVAFGADSAATESAFPDIDRLASSCRFPDCSHTHEPGCQVLEAVSTGKVSPERLRNYQKIQDELSYFSDRESKGAARVEKERWQWVSLKAKAIKKRKKNS